MGIGAGRGSEGGAGHLLKTLTLPTCMSEQDTESPIHRKEYEQVNARSKVRRHGKKALA